MSRRNVVISESVAVASKPTMYVGRVWGLFPFTLEKSGPHTHLCWSRKYAVYSFALGFVLVTLTLRGMIDDLNVGDSKSIRMKKSTAKYVTVGDISIVILIVFVGIFGIYQRIPKLLAFVDCINEIDSMLVISDAKRARRVSIIRLVAVFAITTGIMTADINIWISISNRSSIPGGAEFLFTNYITFYISYYIVFMLECQYWHMVYCVERRIRLLNDCLRMEYVTPHDVLMGVADRAFTVFKPPPSDSDAKLSVSPKSVENMVEILERRKKMSDLFFVRNAKRLRGFTADGCVTKLRRIYLLLCDSADYVNKCCGVPILIILMSCLLHLVVTPYFIFLEIGGRKNVVFLSLQTMWLLTHISRLVIIVEACYACSVQTKNTRPLICKLMCFDFAEKIKREFELFAGELNYRQIEYTACGLFTIDRTLITTIAGAVTTYLVILIQFQKTETS